MTDSIITCCSEKRIEGKELNTSNIDLNMMISVDARNTIIIEAVAEGRVSAAYIPITMLGV